MSISCSVCQDKPSSNGNSHWRKRSISSPITSPPTASLTRRTQNSFCATRAVNFGRTRTPMPRFSRWLCPSSKTPATNSMKFPTTRARLCVSSQSRLLAGQRLSRYRSERVFDCRHAALAECLRLSQLRRSRSFRPVAEGIQRKSDQRNETLGANRALVTHVRRSCRFRTEHFGQETTEFISLGLLRESNGNFLLTRKGKSLADSVAEAFCRRHR